MVNLKKAPKRGAWLDLGSGASAKVTAVLTTSGVQVIFAERTEPGTALAYVHEVAPMDVRATVAWFLEQGFRAVYGQGGRHESFGNVLVEFVRSSITVTVVRDRDQWMIDIRPDGWKYGADLGIILDAIGGRQTWRPTTLGERLENQLPAGVRWVDSLPIALDWLNVTPNAEQLLHTFKLRRSRQIFPPPPRRRRKDLR